MIKKEFFDRYFEDIFIFTLIAIGVAAVLSGVFNAPSNYYIVHDYKIEQITFDKTEFSNLTISGRIIDYIVQETIRQKHLNDSCSLIVKGDCASNNSANNTDSPGQVD